MLNYILKSGARRSFLCLRLGVIFTSVRQKVQDTTVYLWCRIVGGLLQRLEIDVVVPATQARWLWLFT